MEDSNAKKRMYICMAGSLCCIAEIEGTLYINYTFKSPRAIYTFIYDTEYPSLFFSILINLMGKNGIDFFNNMEFPDH